MIEKTPAELEKITGAKCDCCGSNIPVVFGQLGDHLKIGGYHNGKLLEAIVCIKCMKDKMAFIKIQEKDCTIGYC